MTKYLISFPGFTMDHIAEEDFPAMRVAAHAVIMEANDAGVHLWRRDRRTHVLRQTSAVTGQ